MKDGKKLKKLKWKMLNEVNLQAMEEMELSEKGHMNNLKIKYFIYYYLIFERN